MDLPPFSTPETLLLFVGVPLPDLENSVRSWREGSLYMATAKQKRGITSAHVTGYSVCWCKVRPWKRSFHSAICNVQGVNERNMPRRPLAFQTVPKNLGGPLQGTLRSSLPLPFKSPTYPLHLQNSARETEADVSPHCLTNGEAALLTAAIWPATCVRSLSRWVQRWIFSLPFPLFSHTLEARTNLVRNADYRPSPAFTQGDAPLKHPLWFWNDTALKGY